MESSQVPQTLGASEAVLAGGPVQTPGVAALGSHPLPPASSESSSGEGYNRMEVKSKW